MKTSGIKINDSLYKLDVKEKVYNGRTNCEGRLILHQDEFNTAVGFLKGYDYTKIYGVILFIGDIDLCEGKVPSVKDAKSYLIYYADKENYLAADYINTSNGIKESYRVRDTFCDVVSYYLFEESGIISKHAAISISNRDFDVSKTKTIKKSEDLLYRKANQTQS